MDQLRINVGECILIAQDVYLWLETELKELSDLDVVRMNGLPDSFAFRIHFKVDGWNAISISIPPGINATPSIGNYTIEMMKVDNEGRVYGDNYNLDSREDIVRLLKTYLKLGFNDQAFRHFLTGGQEDRELIQEEPITSSSTSRKRQNCDENSFEDNAEVTPPKRKKE